MLVNSSLGHFLLLVKRESIGLPRKHGQLGESLSLYIRSSFSYETVYSFVNIFPRQFCHLYFIFNLPSFSLSFNVSFQQCIETYLSYSCQDITQVTKECFHVNKIISYKTIHGESLDQGKYNVMKKLLQVRTLHELQARKSC